MITMFIIKFKKKAVRIPLLKYCIVHDEKCFVHDTVDGAFDDGKCIAGQTQRSVGQSVSGGHFQTTVQSQIDDPTGLTQLSVEAVQIERR